MRKGALRRDIIAAMFGPPYTTCSRFYPLQALAYVTRHSSHVTRHTSHVTRHTPHMSDIAQAMRSSAAPNKFLFFNFSGHGVTRCDTMQSVSSTALLYFVTRSCSGTRVRDVSGDEQVACDALALELKKHLF